VSQRAGCRHCEVDPGVPPWCVKIGEHRLFGSEVLVIVQIVKDLVVRCAKGAVVGGFEGSQNDGPKYIVNGELVHVLKSSADIADLRPKWVSTSFLESSS
jgi:hypothetical protein